MQVMKIVKVSWNLGEVSVGYLIYNMAEKAFECGTSCEFILNQILFLKFSFAHFESVNILNIFPQIIALKTK